METEEKKLIVTADEVMEYLESNLNRFNEVAAYMSKWAQEMEMVLHGLQTKKQEFEQPESTNVEGAD
jgi:hypothetical protein